MDDAFPGHIVTFKLPPKEVLIQEGDTIIIERRQNSQPPMEVEVRYVKNIGPPHGLWVERQEIEGVILPPAHQREEEA